MAKIRLAIADDHVVFRRGLKSIAESNDNIEVVIEAGNGKELLYLLERNPIPEVLVLDINMPELNGIQTQEILSEKYPGLRTIVLSLEDDLAVMGHMFKLGVNCFLSKADAAEKIELAIYAVCRNGFYFEPNQTVEIQKWLNKNTRKKPVLPNEIKLTQREQDVLKLLN